MNTNLKRRSFLNAASLGIAAAQLGLIAGASAAVPAVPGGISPASNTFTDIKQIRAGVLDVG